MDSIIKDLSTLGIGGLMTAAFVWSYWHMVMRVLPELVRVFREEMATERATHDRHITLLCARMEELEEHCRGRQFGDRDGRPRE